MKSLRFLFLLPALLTSKEITEFKNLDEVRSIVKENMSKLKGYIGKWEDQIIPADTNLPYMGKGKCITEFNYIMGGYYIEQNEKCYDSGSSGKATKESRSVISFDVVSMKYKIWEFESPGLNSESEAELSGNKLIIKSLKSPYPLNEISVEEINGKMITVEGAITRKIDGRLFSKGKMILKRIKS